MVKDIVINEKKAAIALGSVYGLYHLVWGVLVTFGGGFLPWFLAKHFIQVSATAAPFDLVTLILGVVSAAIVGAITGWVFAWIWDKL
ncbi:MAG: hypothetical protein J4432_03070 [DPANN group archaeon]|nr:hypothetical protein [DPANN group archaeon]